MFKKQVKCKNKTEMPLRRIVRLAVGLWLVLGLCLLTPGGGASPEYQTVPTMPPPSLSPTSSPYHTPTNPPQATSTSQRGTRIPPTQTAEATASATVTATATGFTTTPSVTSASTNSPTPLLKVTESEIPTAVLTQEATHAPAGAGGTSLALYGLIGGGGVLVIVILVGVLLGRRQRRLE